MYLDELFRSFRPGRELDVINAHPGLAHLKNRGQVPRQINDYVDGKVKLTKRTHPEVKLVHVEEELGQIEELGDELPHVAGVAIAVIPSSLDGLELAVGVVEFAALQGNVDGREGLEPDEIACDGGGA